MAATRPKRLEQNLAEVARAPFGTGTVEGSLQLTVELAVTTVEPFDGAWDRRAVAASCSWAETRSRSSGPASCRRGRHSPVLDQGGGLHGDDGDVAEARLPAADLGRGLEPSISGMWQSMSTAS